MKGEVVRCAEILRGRFLALDDFEARQSSARIALSWGSTSNPSRIALVFSGLVSVLYSPSTQELDNSEWLEDALLGVSSGVPDALRQTFDLRQWRPESEQDDFFWFTSPGAFEVKVLARYLEIDLQINDD
jgi:hypothetical protein